MLLVAAGHTRLPGQPPDLVAHEWGTFASVAGADGRAVEWLALDGPADLPCFVARTPGVLKGQLTATIRMETPVLYFYTARETRLQVRVGFERGIITEHYPRGAVQSVGLDRTSLQRPGLASRITWRDVRIVPDAPAAFRTERAPNHYYSARRTDAAPIEVGAERERFLFYRGLGGFPAPVGATTGAGDALTITALTNHEIPALLLFENRGGRTGHRVHNRPTRELHLAPPALDGTVESTRRVLERMLVARGLYPKEAAAMVETWRDSWFEEGSRLLYIVPAPVVEAVLPLRIDPAPQHVVRVFVGRLELGASATLSDILTAARIGDTSVEQRYGRFLRPFAERLLAQNLSPVDRARVEKLMTRGSTFAEPIATTCQ
jgi:hypothetical protein